jgi:hypothetical protein
MNNLNIAIVILVVVILLYLFPATRSCVSRSAPWLALVGGGLAVGLLLMASPKRHGVSVSGGASGKRRKGAAKKGAAKRGAAKKRAPKKGKRKGGAEHEALDDDEEVDVTTVEEIEALLDEDGNALPGARRSDAAEEADLTGTGADADDAPDSLGAYVVHAPEPSDEEESSSDDESSDDE